MLGTMVDRMEFESSDNDSKSFPRVESSPREFKVYKRRWFTLALFWALATAIMMQFMIYSIVSDVLVTYYSISYPDAGWSTTVCMISFLIFTIPGSYILDVCDLRICAILASIGSCVGAWIKVGSIDPSRYWVLLLGQGVTAAFQSLIVSLPLKIASVWFGGNEVSTACSLGIVGGQFGLLVSMILAPLIVQSATIDQIEESLSVLAFIMAIYSTIVLITVIIFFRKAPPTPPSYARFTIMKKERNFIDYLKSLKRLFCNIPFVLLLVLTSLLFGVSFPIIINLNQVIVTNYPDSLEHVGYILTANQLSGLVGAFIVGIILDKFHIFRSTFIVLCVISSISCVLFEELMYNALYVTYINSVILGATIYGLYTVAIELSVEITYPEPQSTSGSLIYAVCQLSGIALTYAHAFLFEDVSTFWANMVLYIILIIGNLLLFGMRYDLKRKRVEKELKVAVAEEIVIN